MDTSTERIYTLLQSVFSLNSLVTTPTSQSIQLGNRTITYVPHEENDYFYLGAFIEQDHKDDMDIYNEIIVRIWKNNKVEVYSLRQAHFGHYEESFFKKNGVEHTRSQIRIEANQFFTEWLDNLQKEHGLIKLI